MAARRGVEVWHSKVKFGSATGTIVGCGVTVLSLGMRVRG